MSEWKSDCCVQFLGVFLFSLFLLAFSVLRIHIQLEMMVKQVVIHDVKSRTLPRHHRTDPLTWEETSCSLPLCSFCCLCPLCFLDVWSWRNKQWVYKACTQRQRMREEACEMFTGWSAARTPWESEQPISQRYRRMTPPPGLLCPDDICLWLSRHSWTSSCDLRGRGLCHCPLQSPPGSQLEVRGQRVCDVKIRDVNNSLINCWYTI